MKEIPIVKPEEAELARTIERTLINLPKESGIIFVGVTIRIYDATDKEPRPLGIFVVIGCTPESEPSAVDSLIRSKLTAMLPNNLDTWGVTVWRGISR